METTANVGQDAGVRSLPAGTPQSSGGGAHYISDQVTFLLCRLGALVWVRFAVVSMKTIHPAPDINRLFDHG